MKQVLVRKGIAYTEEVPAPCVSADSVLVRVSHSCISAGTEMMSIKSTGESALGRVIRNPVKIVNGLERALRDGFAETIREYRAKQDVGHPIGYSASGVVIEVGGNIRDIAIGDRVACSGSGIANHAEFIDVPRNLLVKIPEGVDFDLSSTVTLGAIALQGVRRADARIGEIVAVFGLGILGQIAAQLLKVNGCRVIGIDLDDRRVRKALECGMDKGLNPGTEDIVREATIFSGGRGVDAVLITTATDSKEPLSQAFRMCRRKGRVVLVGVVGMEIDREDMYRKELDLLMSTSYGPGRYDESYEAKGIDYPYGYVRWTENRNMEEYLRLIAEKRIDIGKLVERVFGVDNADEAFREFLDRDDKPLIALLEYGREGDAHIARKIQVRSTPVVRDGRINIAVLGAGEFARGVHIPNILKLKDRYALYAIGCRTGSNARAVAQRFGARYATTDYRELLSDGSIDAVLIATRHNLHAQLAIEALEAGKAVLLEKPMALNGGELDRLAQAIRETGRPFMAGFNRRFSKYAMKAKELLARRTDPAIINYQVNAGHIPFDHWVHTEEGGGRIIGEACHIFDLFGFFTDAESLSISVDRISPKTGHYRPQDNVVTTIGFGDGSLCTLTYTALGNRDESKEHCRIYFDGKTIVIDDYRDIRASGVKIGEMRSREPDKGQYEELMAFARYVKGETPPPIPLWQMIQATEISFKVDGAA